MQKVKNFDGQIICKVSQTDKNGENKVEKEIIIKGFKVLDHDRLARTLASAIMADIELSKQFRKKLFVSNRAIGLHVSDGAKHTIFSTVTMESNVQMSLKPRNEEFLYDMLFAALVSIQRKHSVKTSDKMNEFQQKHNVELWKKVAEIAQNAENEVVSE